MEVLKHAVPMNSIPLNMVVVILKHVQLTMQIVELGQILTMPELQTTMLVKMLDQGMVKEV